MPVLLALFYVEITGCHSTVFCKVKRGQIHTVKSVVQVIRHWPSSACCILCHFSWPFCCYTSQQYWSIGVSCTNKTLRTFLKFADQLLRQLCNTPKHRTGSLSWPLFRLSAEVSPRSQCRRSHCAFQPRTARSARAPSWRLRTAARGGQRRCSTGRDLRAAAESHAAAARCREAGLTFVGLNSLSFITDHRSGMNIFTCVLLSAYNI